MKSLLTVLCVATLASACSKAPVSVAQAAAAPAPVVDMVAAGEQLCRRDITKHVQFRDPTSVRVNSVEAGGLGKTGQHFNMSVSAKNGFGGYANPTPCSCVADVGNDRLNYAYCASGA